MEEWRPFVAQWQRADERHETSPPAEVRGKDSRNLPTGRNAGPGMGHPPASRHKKDQRHRIVLALVKTLEDNPHPVVAHFLVAPRRFFGVRRCPLRRRGRTKKTSLDHYVPLLLSGLQTPIEADIQCMLKRHRTSRHAIFLFREVRDRFLAHSHHFTARKFAELAMPTAIQAKRHTVWLSISARTRQDRLCRQINKRRLFTTAFRQ